MSLIPPQVKHTRQTINLRLDVQIVATLREYAEFIDSTQDHVVQHALRLVFERDKTFQAWRAQKRADGVGPLTAESRGNISTRARSARSTSSSANTTAT
jgi:hypothetical protein